MYMRPSFLGLVFGGIVILIAVIMIWNQRRSISGYDAIMIALLMSIAISVHSLLHGNEEIYFRFNPMIGQ